MSDLARVLEPEVMDDAEEARAYDAMDHAAVNGAFVEALLASGADPRRTLDVGTGTARIPIELVARRPEARVVAVDLAPSMLDVARENVRRAGLEAAIELRLGDGKGLAFDDGAFTAVMSNSIVHHVPTPATLFAELARVTAPGGTLFVRDLLRPRDRGELDALVALHAAHDTEQQRQLFADSLHAALTLDEVRACVAPLGIPAEAVSRSSDRHWTLCVRVGGTTPPA